MNKIWLFLAVLFLAVNGLAAQEQEEEEEIQTIFGNSEMHSSGYGGPVVKFTQFNDELSLFIGAKGGWTINRTFTIGLAGYGMVWGPDVDYTSGNSGTIINSNMHFGYGGLYLEYINNSNDALHFTVNTLIGAGGVIYVNSENDYFDDDHWEHEPWAAYFVVEPGVSLEFNLLKFFRVGFEASYRFCNDMKTNTYFKNSTGLDDVNVDGWSAGFVFKFGSF